MKKLLLAALLLSMISFTAAFTVSMDTVKQSANQSSPAVFEVNIQNDQANNHSYSISILSPKSSWLYYPNTLHVSSGPNKTFNITASPVENALQQRYRFDGKIREQATGEMEEFSGIFNVQQPYKLHIVDLTQNKQSFTPGEVISTAIEIKNLDSSPVDNYQVNAKYRNQSKTDSGTSMLPGSTRRYEFNFKTSKNASPGKHNITYTVTADEKLQTTARQTATIGSVENITRKEETENRILTYAKTVQSTNNGNSPVNTTITTQVPSYLESITSTTPQPDKIEEIEGEIVYSWNARLEPRQSFSAQYQTKYWIPVTGVLLLLAGIVAIKVLGTSISLTKTAEEDGNSIKINLEIENNGEKTIEQLELEEFIPDIATVDESFSMNTPKIRKTSEGTKLTWQIKDLEPGDQRIIQYKIRPKVQVEEEVDFQPAVIRNMDGKKIAESNTTSAEFTP